ncbi:MAG: transaldolase [Oligoflexia bacterium]|nr:transaldolase [Oligoflexia bacterium]
MQKEMNLIVNNKVAARVSFQGKNAPDRLIDYDMNEALKNAEKFYSEFYAQSKNPLAKTREIQFEQLIKILNPYLGQLSTKTTLDVGCGNGSFVDFLEKNLSNDFKSFGVEPALKEETAKLKKISLHEISNNNKIPQNYSLVSLLDVFEHFSNPEEGLTHLTKLIENQGLLLLKVPNKNSTFYRLGKALRGFLPPLSNLILSRLFQINYPPPHFFYYDLESLERALEPRFMILHKSFMSECPVRGLWTRFWGIPTLLRPLAICLGLIYRLFSLRNFNDAIVILAQKRGLLTPNHNKNNGFEKHKGDSMTQQKLKIHVYADGANKEEMIKRNKEGFVKGFTTNPTLMAKVGIKDYEAFARDVLKDIKDLPISFEVFSDDFNEMKKQALKINSWGSNVNVKIPITNTKKQPSLALIKDLLAEGIKLNVTAIFTREQLIGLKEVMKPQDDVIVSVFAGRIADAGVDPIPVMQETVKMFAPLKGAKVLWASPREVLNAYQAEECGCHIITMTDDLIKKLSLRGKDLTEYSLDTVKMFYDDATKAGFSL